jgi:hypothetical protein
MSPNPQTTQKSTTVPPHISINNGWMGTFQVPILSPCTVWRHMSHMNKRCVHIGGRWCLVKHREPWPHCFCGNLSYFHVNKLYIATISGTFNVRQIVMYQGYKSGGKRNARCIKMTLRVYDTLSAAHWEYDTLSTRWGTRWEYNTLGARWEYDTLSAGYHTLGVCLSVSWEY